MEVYFSQSQRWEVQDWGASLGDPIYVYVCVCVGRVLVLHPQVTGVTRDLHCALPGGSDPGLAHPSPKTLHLHAITTAVWFQQEFCRGVPLVQSTANGCEASVCLF